MTRFVLGGLRRLRYRPTIMWVRSFRHVRRSLISGLGLFVAVTTLASVSVAADDKDTSTMADGESTAQDTASSDTATADDSPAQDEPASDTGDQPHAKTQTRGSDTSHKGQFAVRVAAVGGFHIVMRYDESPLCAEPEAGKEPRKFCGFGAPLSLDTAIGYAPVAGVEPFLWGRFGLAEETQTHTKPLLMFGAGVRIYTMSDAPFKFFIEPAVGTELETGASDSPDDSSAYKQDYLVRLAVGPQYDFNRYIGLYLAGSMSLGIVRSLNSSMELHGGLQARFP